MARSARKLDAYGIYAVRQTASDMRVLFQNTEDRLKFLTILKETKIRFKFKLYALCVKSPSHYDLIIDANGSDLSKIMKSINIAYAIYAAGEGKLFKDRYKSQVLALPQDVVARIETFKLEQATCKDLDKIAASLIILDPYDISPYSKNKNCDQCIRNVGEAKLKLAEIAKGHDQSLETLLKDKTIRDQLILDFRRSSTLSLKALGDVFGGLSESSVCKILKDQCHQAY